MKVKRFLMAAALMAAVLPMTAQDFGEEAPYVPSILVVEDDAAVQALEEQGVIVMRRRADMVLALVPRENQTAQRTRGVRKMERGRRAVPTMDEARASFGADKIIEGEGLEHPYTGRGVVVGLCDIGIDPHHIAFLDENGNSRVKKIVHYRETYGERTQLDTPEQIAQWTTDNSDNWHGTHVLNTMAGSFRGSPYYGIASDAEIVATSGEFYDAGILAACEDIVEYAHEVGKPAVINLSLSSYTGPHDGTSLFSRYMEELGKEAIVCMAAGNEGKTLNSYRKTFGEQDTNWMVRIRNTTYDNFHIMGLADTWSGDTQPLGVKLYVFDENVNGPVYEKEICLPDNGEQESYVSSETDAEFAQFLQGWVALATEINPLNGRWHCEINYDTLSSATSNKGGWSRYVIAFEFTGQPGTYAEFFTDCQYSLFQNWGSWPVGNSISVSDICSGANVVSVGMSNSRESYPMLDGSDKSTGATAGTINGNSSYGTLIDGSVLPHTVAPGGLTVSACNGQYIAAHPDKLSIMSAESEVDGKKYYWCGCGGTSMATPYTAGVIATWLEAVPDLGIDKVLEIISDTNRHDYPDAGNPRHGQGWLDPYEGLKLALQHSSSTLVSTEVADSKVVIRDGRIEIMNPGGGEIGINLWTAAGTKTVSLTGEGTVVSFALPEIEPGFYIWELHDGAQRRQTGKLRIR